MEFPCPSHQYHQYHQYHQCLSAQEFQKWHGECSKSSLGARYRRAHPHSNPPRKRKGLKSNKIPLSSCSQDTVWTNSPQKASPCNLVPPSCSWSAAISACEARAGEQSKPPEGVPAIVCKVLSHLPGCGRGISAPTESSGSTVPPAPGLHTRLDTSPLSYRCFGWSPRRYSCLNTCAFSTQQTARTTAAGLQRLDPRATMREAGEVFLWEISVVTPVVSLFLVLFADCSALRPWGR